MSNLFVLLLASALATDYTVTPGQNWNAYKTSLQPGDTLTFRPQTAGTPYKYTITSSNKWFLYGSATKPIIVQGAPGEQITMEMDACQNAVELNGAYFVFQNFKVATTANAPGAIGVRLMPNASHAVLNKITITDIAETAISANMHDSIYNNVTISNCEISRTGGTGECIYVGCQGGSPGTVDCQFINGAIINNYCHDTCVPNGCSGGSEGSGYQLKGWGSYNNVIRGNVCERVNTVCILLYDDYDLGRNLVERNFVYGSVVDAGIQVSAGAIIRNNVIVGNQQGIVVTPNSVNLAPGKLNRNLDISGNTIVNNNGVGIRIPSLNPTSGSRIANNVVIEDSGSAFSSSSGSQTGVTWLKNAYFGGSLPGGVGAGGAFTVGASSTLFQNVAGYNFHPKAGSALLAAGTAIAGSDATTDYDCQTRSASTPAVGAYESTTGPALVLGFQAACGPTPGAPTSAPTSLTPTRAPTTACSTINCGAHGTCTNPNPVCVCNDSYTGSRCETPPPDPCVGNPPAVDCGAHGTCNNGVCTCFGNYTGTLCTTPPAPTCTDGVKNSDEAGIDCGGAVAKCPACPSYYERAGNWTACTVSCGNGTQTRVVECVNSVNGNVVAASFCSNVTHNLTTIQSCNSDPCPTYSWRTGTWDNCSAPCGTGFQTRVVECISSVGAVVVADSLCGGGKPASNQTCNTVACVAPHWVTGAWSTCSSPCGGGMQTRTANCFDAQDMPVSAGLCPAPTPITSQLCNTEVCVTYGWKACQTFYPCTAQCNGGGAMVGTQSRDVFCIRDTDNQAVDTILCDNATKPNDLLSVCNTQPCTDFNWMADGNFGPCIKQPSGVYQRFRTFHCHAASGALAQRSDCEAYAGKLPISVLPCTPGTCASANGCPVVEIAELFNQCFLLSMLTSCDTASLCGQASRLLETQMSTLGFTTQAGAAQQCVNVYVASLSANEAPKADVLTYVLSKINSGTAMCIPATSGVLAVVPSALVLLAALSTI